jgi:hypothetical protein
MVEAVNVADDCADEFVTVIKLASVFAVVPFTTNLTLKFPVEVYE